MNLWASLKVEIYTEFNVYTHVELSYVPLLIRSLQCLSSLKQKWISTQQRREWEEEKKNLILEQVEAQNLDYDKFFFVVSGILF